jgi:hypothetical protein
MSMTLVKEAGRTVPKGTHEFVVLSRDGRAVYTWDPTDAVSLAEVETIWNRVTTEDRLMGYTVPSNGDAEVIKDFDPNAEHLVASMPLAGG